jgi:hypothetical protein
VVIAVEGDDDYVTVRICVTATNFSSHIVVLRVTALALALVT